MFTASAYHGAVRHRRLVPTAGLLALALLAGACGGGHRSPSTAAGTSGSTVTTSAGGSDKSSPSTVAKGETATTAAGGKRASGPTGTPGRSGGSAPTVATAAAPSSTSPTTTAAHSNSGVAAALAPTAPGTYQESQSGSLTGGGHTYTEPPQGTLVVEPASAGASQEWERYTSSNEPPSDTTVQFRADGPFIVSDTQSIPSGTVTCTFTPAIPAPRWPAASGQTFSSTGHCGSLTVTLNGTTSGPESVSIGGTSYTTWVIITHLSAKGDNITDSGTQTDWYSPVLRLPVKETVSEKGTYEGIFPFSIVSNSELESARPS